MLDAVSAPRIATRGQERLDVLGRRIVVSYIPPGKRWLGRPLGAWTAQAACLGTDPQLFFPEPTHGGAQGRRPSHQIEQARHICLGCPVIADCLRHALEHVEAGIWGGTTETQREELRRIAGRRK